MTSSKPMKQFKRLLKDELDQSSGETTAADQGAYPQFEQIRLNEALPAAFERIFLRDSCSCSRCVDPSTTQKLFETADIPREIDVQERRQLPDGRLEITWKNDMPGFEDHVSIYSSTFLRKAASYSSRLRASHNLVKRRLWNTSIMAHENCVIDYKAYLSSTATLHTALKRLQLYGLLFLVDVPSDPTAIEAIANRIGPLRNTFYGSTWDVRSVPSAKNVAYTARDLGFHMDLLYMADPPGVQILHCIKASTQGGESLFSDGFRALEIMKRHFSQLANSFRKYPVTYRYKNSGHWYQYTRPSVEYDTIINTDSFGDIYKFSTNYSSGNDAAINWSPPFQAPFERDTGHLRLTKNGPSRMRLYLAAAKKFKELIERQDAVYETKMQEGTCVIFNNRRVLHARRAFDGNEGERWLRGAYIDTDVFRSRLRVLDEQSEEEKESRQGV
ncbi:hypothetical protein MMC24_005266 [Lignoscripta atroalba]|nr:hypothetical protein [Lignoscripta atroalba]